MKKILISLLLVLMVCIPAFSTETMLAYTRISGGASATFCIDKTVKLRGVGVFCETGIPFSYLTSGELDTPTSRIGAIGKVEFKYSFDNDSSVNGIYTQLAAYLQPYSAINESKNLSYGYAKAGLGADFHLIDGQLKTNLGVVAGGTLYVNNIVLARKTSEGTISPLVYLIPNPSIDATVTFVNKTSAPVFSFEIGSGLDLINIITSLRIQKEP